MSSIPEQTAILLLAHGTPETVDQIPEYLKNVVSGRPLPKHVVEEIQHRYSLIGKSPLTTWTLREAELLQQTLGIPVYVGMRNWRPYIGDIIRQMRADGIRSAVAICMAPQNSRTSVGLYRRAAFAEAGENLQLHFIDGWATLPKLAEAFADRLRPAWRQACAVAGKAAPVVFTAHSVPCRTIQVPGAIPPATTETPAINQPPDASSGPVRPTAPERSYAVPGPAAATPDPYATEAKRTAGMVAERMAADGLLPQGWFFAFQSQGASGGPWIGPSVEDTLQALAQEGHRAAVLQPVGFLCDHVEILYDVDIAFQELAQSLGLQLFRPESLNDSPLLIEALAELSHRGLEALQQPGTMPAQ
jgi:ferrochelatase